VLALSVPVVLGAHVRSSTAVFQSRAASVPPAGSAAGPSGAGRRLPAQAFASSWLDSAGSPDLGVHAASAVVVDLDARSLLWQREGHAARAPASLAKIVTAMVGADLAPLDREVPVPAEATQVEGDSTLMGLSPGEVVTLRDLMYGVFLRSGNDAAEAIAGGLTSRDRFVRLMNDKAAALGMADSHFTNPTGLDEPGMRTSAYDMAIAASAVVARYPELLAISGTVHTVLPRTASHKAFDLHALNRLLGPYPGATGMKTGYTDDAGYCLVGTAVRGGRHLLAVLMGDDLSLAADAVRLLDYGFSVRL
jgi:D-alanyl-D-alanine carboxypeptidase (penicillin-binding protein 5/6)